MDKEEAKKQLKSLQKEVDKLTEIINKPGDLFSKIKNYSDVCSELGEDKETCPYKKIKQIEKLFNGNWIKDFSGNQKNWYPYFEYKAGLGLVFCGSDDSYGYSYCVVAFYKDEKTSNFCGKTFQDIYNQL